MTTSTISLQLERIDRKGSRNNLAAMGKEAYVMDGSESQSVNSTTNLSLSTSRRGLGGRGGSGSGSASASASASSSRFKRSSDNDRLTSLSDHQRSPRSFREDTAAGGGGLSTSLRGTRTTRSRSHAATYTTHTDWDTCPSEAAGLMPPRSRAQTTGTTPSWETQSASAGGGLSTSVRWTRVRTATTKRSHQHQHQHHHHGASSASGGLSTSLRGSRSQHSRRSSLGGRRPSLPEHFHRSDSSPRGPSATATKKDDCESSTASMTLDLDDDDDDDDDDCDVLSQGTRASYRCHGSYTPEDSLGLLDGIDDDDEYEELTQLDVSLMNENQTTTGTTKGEQPEQDKQATTTMTNPQLDITEMNGNMILADIMTAGANAFASQVDYCQLQAQAGVTAMADGMEYCQEQTETFVAATINEFAKGVEYFQEQAEEFTRTMGSYFGIMPETTTTETTTTGTTTTTTTTTTTSTTTTGEE